MNDEVVDLRGADAVLAGKLIPYKEDADNCPSTNSGYLCTREAGHPLPHVAHGMQNEVVAYWTRHKA